MMNKRESGLKMLVVLFPSILLAVIYSCANIARPGGGPRDTEPPEYVKSNPTLNQKNFSKKRVDIEFDEIVQIDNPSEKVIISPPQKEMPIVRAQGHKVVVELRDTLLPNTSYTIDFGDAITDNNEKNVLRDFSLSFSTGNFIDTMQVSGVLLGAQNLEPVTGMLVGLHKDTDDSAFVTKPFDRVGISDAYGRFSLKSLSPGTYRLYALKDMNRDYRFDNPTEDIAFLDSLVIPTVEMKLHTDTIWADSVTVDTVIMSVKPHYFPNDLLLRSFNENFKSRYLEKNERTNRRKLSLYFSTPADTLPVFEPLSFKQKDWAIIERTAHNDTITYWIKDSLVYQQDTLSFSVDYLRTDSLMNLSMSRDTVKMLYRQPRNMANNKKKKDGDVPLVEFLNMTTKVPSVLNIYDRLSFVFDQPLAEIKPEAFRLEHRVDSVWKPVEFKLKQDSLRIRDYGLSAKWRPGDVYRVSVDSAMITGIYGNWNAPYKQEFRVRKLEEYANLYLSVPAVEGPAFVELLNTSDVPVRKSKVINGGAEFGFLDPGTYYARLILDRNGNNLYDTGKYSEKRQPEEVFYYPEKFVLRANWDVEQEWDIYARPLDMQKPREIVKNKPKEIKDQEKQDNENSQESRELPRGFSSSGRSYPEN